MPAQSRARVQTVATAKGFIEASVKAGYYPKPLYRSMDQCVAVLPHPPGSGHARLDTVPEMISSIALQLFSECMDPNEGETLLEDLRDLFASAVLTIDGLLIFPTMLWPEGLKPPTPPITETERQQRRRDANRRHKEKARQERQKTGKGKTHRAHGPSFVITPARDSWSIKKP